ncbi:hypothetical protein NDU88_008582 [Pleurodeles waltl]|uniref:Uncharacterized protein n=1 Tax=Pleurodeles waltl TaxID=8319 RepID=A0AAV7QSW2_PLEWA|nr:hypothetical protein NDU88_008582 [Pleurodeles waltl]
MFAGTRSLGRFTAVSGRHQYSPSDLRFALPYVVVSRVWDGKPYVATYLLRDGDIIVFGLNIILSVSTAVTDPVIKCVMKEVNRQEEAAEGEEIRSRKRRRPSPVTRTTNFYQEKILSRTAVTNAWRAAGKMLYPATLSEKHDSQRCLKVCHSDLGNRKVLLRWHVGDYEKGLREFPTY